MPVRRTVQADLGQIVPLFARFLCARRRSSPLTASFGKKTGEICRFSRHFTAPLSGSRSAACRRCHVIGPPAAPFIVRPFRRTKRARRGGLKRGLWDLNYRLPSANSESIADASSVSPSACREATSSAVCDSIDSDCATSGIAASTPSDAVAWPSLPAWL